jgi:hypothetical protein
MKDNKKSNKIKISSIELNNYVKPDPHTLVVQSNRFVTNGTDNDYFYYVENRYLGSPTNQAIIDNYANYILGDGLYDETGNINLEDILDEEDLRMAITDFKLHGACVFQVVYGKGKEKVISKLYYLPTKTIAIYKQADITDEIEKYWYCFDWKNKTKFKPYTVPAFGYGEDNESEILYIKRQSPQPLFALPDYQSGLQYCEVEEELSNYYNNHIKNNFSAGKIINVNQGESESDEAEEEAEKAILSKVKGTSNAGNIIVSFNANKDNETTVTNIEITDAYQQFETLSKESREKIMLSHKVNDPSLFGLPLPSGFSSVAEQMVQSLKILYRSQINPMRKIITKGLENVLKLNNPSIKLKFKDYEELKVQQQPQQTQMMSSERVSFDFDDTLTTDKGLSLFEDYLRKNYEVYIISARYDFDGELKKFADKYKIPYDRIFTTGDNKSKIIKVYELGITTHFDNNPDVINKLPNIGKLI